MKFHTSATDVNDSLKRLFDYLQARDEEELSEDLILVYDYIEDKEGECDSLESRNDDLENQMYEARSILSSY